jgi:hypothetical protein
MRGFVFSLRNWAAKSRKTLAPQRLNDSGGNGFLSFIGIRNEYLGNAHVAQLVERVLGKDEVISSNLIMGSRIYIEKQKTQKQTI